MRKLLPIWLVLCPALMWAGTCGAGYSYVKKITIDHFMVPSSQTNFPWLLCFNGACAGGNTTLTDLKTVANSGLIQNTAANAISVTGPADLVFCPDTTLTSTPMKYETARYLATSGATEIYVQTNLSSSADTVFYMYYGNPGVSTTQQDLSLWTDVSFAAVYHFPDGTTLGLKDSTNTNNGTNHSATATAGQIDGGINISTQYVTAASSSTFKPTSALTVEAWTYANSCPTVAVIAGVGYRNTGVWSEPFWAWGFRNFQCRPLLTLAVSGSRKDSGFTGATTSTGAWHYQAGVYNGANLLTYLDGANINSPAQTGSIDYNSGGSDALSIGTDSAASQGEYWDGKLDEIRISTIARSADWLKISYNNGVSPAGMYSVSDPTAVGCSGYSFRRSITVDHTKVPNTDRTNFPMLVNGTYSWLATVANGGNLQSSSGFDVCYASDSAGSTGLPYDTDHWTATSGDAGYWVLVPTIATGSDTVIYIFYGNSSITTTQANPTAVWGPDYKTVYHLGNGTTLSLADSGITGNLLTQTGTVGAAAGMIGGSALFTSGNYLSNTGLGYPIATTTRVMSMWMKFTSLSSGIRIAGYGSAGVQGEDFRWEWTSPNFSLSIGNGSKFGTWSQDTNWHYVVAVFSGTTNANITIYMDGALFGSTSSVNVWTLNTPACCVALSGSSGSSQFPGNIDEFRIRTGSETADWIATEYNNQNSASTFYTISGPTSIAHKRRMSQVY
jgi:hypothetical protein